MGKRRDRTRLALEARKELRISRHVPGQHLDRNVPLELRVPRPVHLTHSTRSERRQNLVAPEPPARRQSRRVPSRLVEDRSRGLQRRRLEKGTRGVHVDQQRLRPSPHLLIWAGFCQKRRAVGCGNGQRPRQDAFHALPFLSVHEVRADPRSDARSWPALCQQSVDDVQVGRRDAQIGVCVGAAVARDDDPIECVTPAGSAGMSCFQGRRRPVVRSSLSTVAGRLPLARRTVSARRRPTGSDNPLAPEALRAPSAAPRRLGGRSGGSGPSRRRGADRRRD